MPTYSEIGDKIKGYRILWTKTTPRVILKIQRTILKDNAEATILAKVKYL